MSDDTIRQQVEDLIRFLTPVTVMTDDVCITGHLDGMGEQGFWLRPINLMYIPFTDVYSIRTAVPDEVE